MNDADSENIFENLVKKAVAAIMTDSDFNPEEEELFYKFIEDKDSNARFYYNKKAAEAGYLYSFYYVGRAYLFGDGCEKSFEKACYWLGKSIENGQDGATLLGDCYRLGKEVPMDYETAWKYYAKLNYSNLGPDDECTLDEKTIGDVTLGRPSFGLDHSLPVDWWEFVMTKISGDSSCFAEMSWLYKEDSERWLFWIKKAADAGDIFAMGKLFERLPTQDERIKYFEQIFEAAQGYDEAFHDIAKDIIKGDYPPEIKEKAVRKFVPFEYEKKDKELMDKYNCFVDYDDDYVSPYDRGMVVCPYCHNEIPQDDIDDPDKQGEVCNDCYYSGRYMEEDDDK